MVPVPVVPPPIYQGSHGPYHLTRQILRVVPPSFLRFNTHSIRGWDTVYEVTGYSELMFVFTKVSILTIL